MGRKRDARKPGRTVLEKRRAKQEKRSERVTTERRRDALNTTTGG